MPVNSGTSSRVGRHYAKSLNAPVVVTTVNPASSSSWVRASTLTPNYRKLTLRRKPSGIDLPMNPFEYTKVSSVGRQGLRYSKRVRKSDGVLISLNEDWGDFGFNGGLVSEDSAVWATLEADMTRRMLNDLKDQSTNLGVAIGEGKQTANLYLDAAKRIASAGRSLRQGNLAGAASAFAGISVSKRQDTNYLNEWKKKGPLALANGWLQLQYGWKPHLSDIYGSLEFLANKLHRMPRYRVSKGGSKTVTTTSVAPPGGIGFGDLTTVSNQYDVKIIIYYSGSENHDPSSLGLTNPLMIAWELVPWSFVVDWMLPIGNYLNNLDATYGLTFVKGCKTRFFRGRTTIAEFGVSGQTTTDVVSNISTVLQVRETVHCTRAKLTGFPSVPPPKLKSPFSPMHIANASALLFQAFHGPGKKGPY